MLTCRSPNAPLPHPSIPPIHKWLILIWGAFGDFYRHVGPQAAGLVVVALCHRRGGAVRRRGGVGTLTHIGEKQFKNKRINNHNDNNHSHFKKRYIKHKFKRKLRIKVNNHNDNTKQKSKIN